MKHSTIQLIAKVLTLFSPSLRNHVRYLMDVNPTDRPFVFADYVMFHVLAELRDGEHIKFTVTK